MTRRAIQSLIAAAVSASPVIAEAKRDLKPLTEAQVRRDVIGHIIKIADCKGAFCAVYSIRSSGVILISANLQSECAYLVDHNSIVYPTSDLRSSLRFYRDQKHHLVFILSQDGNDSDPFLASVESIK